MGRILLVAGLAVILCTAVCYDRVTFAKAKTIEVVSREAVKIKDASVTYIDDHPFLSYSIVNRSSKQVTNLLLVVSISDSNGRMKAGESWRKSINLPAHSTVNFTAPLNLNTNTDERIMLSLEAVQYMNDKDSGEVQPQMAPAPCGDDWCSGGEARADSACGGQIGSFSCSINGNSCSYSWTCR